MARTALHPGANRPLRAAPLRVRTAWLVGLVARLLLGGLFVYAGVMKTWDAATFAKEIDNYRIVPVPWLHAIAILMPPFEVVVGALFVLGVWVPECGTLLMGMLIAFTAAVGSAMHRNLDINCGCFGGDMKVGWLKVAENSGLMLACILAVVGWWLSRRWRAGAGTRASASPSSQAAPGGSGPALAESTGR